MPSTIAPGPLRHIFGRDQWLPPDPFGPNGWRMVRKDRGGSVIATAFEWEDGVEWIHASVAFKDHMPEYEDLVKLKLAVFGDGWAFQVFAPSASHVNIHPNALHLWGRADGAIAHPDFAGTFGSI